MSVSKGSKCSILFFKSHVGIGSRRQVALEHDLKAFNNSDGVTKSNVSNKATPSSTLSSNLLLGIEWYEINFYSNLFNFVHK